MTDSKYADKLVAKSSDVKVGDELWLVKHVHPTQAHKVPFAQVHLLGMKVKVAKIRFGVLELEANSWRFNAQESAVTYRKWMNADRTVNGEEFILIAFSS